MIAGNKCDINNRQIPLETAESFALSIGGKHYGTSAKTGQGVTEVFSALSTRILDSKKSKKGKGGGVKPVKGGLNVGGFGDDDAVPGGGTRRGESAVSAVNRFPRRPLPSCFSLRCSLSLSFLLTASSPATLAVDMTCHHRCRVLF